MISIDINSSPSWQVPLIWHDSGSIHPPPGMKSGDAGPRHQVGFPRYNMTEPDRTLLYSRRVGNMAYMRAPLRLVRISDPLIRAAVIQVYEMHSNYSYGRPSLSPGAKLDNFHAPAS